MNYKRQIKEAAFRPQSVLPERELNHCSAELLALESQHILPQHCLWRACILLQKITAPSFGPLIIEETDVSAVPLLPSDTSVTLSGSNTFRVKGSNFIRFFF